MNGDGKPSRNLAIALLAGLGVLVAAIVITLFRPNVVPQESGPTSSPTAVAGGSPTPAYTASPMPTATAGIIPSVSPTASPTASPTTSPASAAPATPTTTLSPPSPSPSAPPPTGWIEITDFPTYRGTTTVGSITAGGPGFVAIGSGGRGAGFGVRIWTSSDGQRWTAQPDDVFGSYSLRKIVRLDEALYVFGRGVDGLRVWRSADGRDWISLDASPELQWAGFNDVVVVGQSMLAVGFLDNPDTGEFGGAAWRSGNGVDWQRVAVPGGQVELWAVAAQGSTVVGIDRFAAFGAAPVWYSTDLGETWQPAETDFPTGEDASTGLVSVAANDQRFVAVGYADTFDYPPIAARSGDGISFTSIQPSGYNLLGQVLALPGGGFLALEGNGNRALVSSDGRSWTQAPPLITSRPGPPMPPEGGDEVVTSVRQLAAGRGGVVVAEEWGDGVRVWFGPTDMFRP